MFLYIDATAGGLLIQVLLGGFAGIGFIGRLLWSRLGGRSVNEAEGPDSRSAGPTEHEKTDRETTDRAA